MKRNSLYILATVAAILMFLGNPAAAQRRCPSNCPFATHGHPRQVKRVYRPAVNANGIPIRWVDPPVYAGFGNVYPPGYFPFRYAPGVVPYSSPYPYGGQYYNSGRACPPVRRCRPVRRRCR